MDFPTQYDKQSKDYITESGSPYRQDYEYALDDEGHKILTKKDSYTDVYAIIQAEKDSVDINVLMKRFALGDTEALNIKTGYFLDTRNMPTNIHEVYSMGLEADQYFEGLPVEVKEMFDNSSSVFFTEMNNDPKTFNSKINSYNYSLEDHSFEDPNGTNNEEINYHE